MADPMGKNHVWRVRYTVRLFGCGCVVLFPSPVDSWGLDRCAGTMQYAVCIKYLGTESYLALENLVVTGKRVPVNKKYRLGAAAGMCSGQ